MKVNALLIIAGISLFACSKKEASISPTSGNITESIYASGTIKSADQYQAFVSVSGIIEEIYVKEGQQVSIGTPLLRVSNETQKFNLENAQLAANFNDVANNQGKLTEAEAIVQTAKAKLKLDSSLYSRQKALWSQQVGTRIEFEQKELNYQSSKANYLSANQRYKDLKRQINFGAAQTKKNVQISARQNEDFILKSKVNGTVFSILKEKGELVSPQTPIATLGNSKNFRLEMQVDEHDIFKVKLGQKVAITFDAYKNQYFEAEVNKIASIMNERNKTFLIEAQFTKAPEKLYPNVTFEASIILQSKQNVLILPRNYIKNDSIVTLVDGSKRIVKLGLTDFQKAEVISGLSAKDQVIKPE
ncbi:efflux RND transporter periplasmic adaptor subunit [Aquirufa echingensis]|uniref:Efflux RND transporter periplasmic adaptor subunit n=1 Tax=Aquirufa echingensis TaxID=3096516 RepID=A0ABW6CWA6_9BACT